MQDVQDRSEVLPTAIYDKTLAGLIGLPNGAHTGVTAVQNIDYYGNVTNFTVQTVKTDAGNTVFLTMHNAAEGYKQIILPPRVLALIQRQADTVSTIVRRRHGRRIAEERAASGNGPVFTPEMRAKALAARRAKARKRRK